MAVVKFRSLKPEIVLGLLEVFGTIGLGVGVSFVVAGFMGNALGILYGMAVVGSGLVTLLGVVLVRTLIRIAESNDRIVLELENL